MATSHPSLRARSRSTMSGRESAEAIGDQEVTEEAAEEDGMAQDGVAEEVAEVDPAA